MLVPERRSLWTVLALFGILSGVTGWVWWLVMRDPDIPFLTRRSPAEWILYSMPPSGFTHPGVELEATFRNSFVLERRPSSAILRMRCYRDGMVAINGTPVDFASGSATDWKRFRAADVSALLSPGANEISAHVRSHFGPPALWLSVEGEEFAWNTDGSWAVSLAGAEWRPARLATTPMDRWSPLGEEPADDTTGAPKLASRVFDAARRSLPTWAAFAALTAVLLLSFRISLRWRPVRGELSPDTRSSRDALSLAALAALCWAILTWHDIGKQSNQLFGFDVEGHLAYIQYILARARLPLAHEGWEMYQPPLYYAVAAGILRSFGYTALEYDTLVLLRWINWPAGILLLASLLGSLRLMFPECPRRWITGFGLGAFLPAQLYMSQYISNETWAAAWGSTSLYLCLRIIRRDETSLGSHLLLGVLLGAAMLTKFSLLIVVGVIAVVLAGRLLVRGERSPAVYARSLGAMLLACGLVSGWHFLRVQLRFGKPLVGNWDPATGFSWWQDPGYHTSEYYLAFGQSLVEPIFSSYHSFADGIFSTLWGDGLLGGSSQRDVRPPWNYDLMVSGYLLACLPSLAILVGLAAAVIDLVRKPRAEWFLVLGIFGATAFAILVMTLRLPFHSQAKAFYGLSALIPISALGAWGFDVLAASSRAVRTLLYLLLGTWALNACASFWIRG